MDKIAAKAKSIFLAGIVLLGALTAEAVSDDNGLMVRDVANKPGVYKVIYYGGETGVVTMTVYNKGGEKVFQETLRNSKEFIRLVNLTAIGSGTYTIEVKDGKNVLESKVEYK